ncbi:hypothetical protein JCM10296v2_007550 [Rhodotorula toruloides]
MDESLSYSAGLRALSSTPASPLEDNVTSLKSGTRTPSTTATSGSDGVAGASSTLTGLDQASQSQSHVRSSTQGSQAAAQSAEQPPAKRTKTESGAERWTKEEELALLDIRTNQAKVTWEDTPNKMVAQGFPKRSVRALRHRWDQMDGASGNPVLESERDNSWTNDELLAILGLIKNHTTAPGAVRKNTIKWDDWLPEFPGKTRYQVMHKGMDLRKMEDRPQADRQQAELQAALTRASSSANGDASLKRDKTVSAFVTTAPAPTSASASIPNHQMPSVLITMNGSAHPAFASPSISRSSSHHAHSFQFPQQTSASPRPSTLHHPSASTMSAQLGAHLEFAIDTALSTTSPVPPLQNARPLHFLNHAILDHSRSAQRLPQSAFAPREQPHQPISAASVSPALPAKPPFIAAELAKFIVDVTGQTASQPRAASAQKPAVDKEAEKRKKPRWRTDLDDEEDTSWVPKSKSGLKLEEKLQGIARRLRE